MENINKPNIETIVTDVMTNTNTTNTTTNTNMNKIDNINYITLEIMANSDTYNKYLKRNNLEHDTVLKGDKRFYRKRIAAMAKDILNNNVNNNSDSPINDVIINAFNTFARLCISHFKFKDTMDNIQGDYKDMNLVNTSTGEASVDTINGWSMDEANKLFMKQVDKKVITMDNFVKKTSPPQDEMIIPKTKDLNLKDPKYKKKDIKKGFTKNHISNGVKWADTNEVIEVKVTKSENSNI
jgi:phage-related protein